MRKNKNKDKSAGDILIEAFGIVSSLIFLGVFMFADLGNGNFHIKIPEPPYWYEVFDHMFWFIVLLWLGAILAGYIWFKPKQQKK